MTVAHIYRVSNNIKIKKNMTLTCSFLLDHTVDFEIISEDAKCFP